MKKESSSTLIVYADFSDEIPNIDAVRRNETTSVYRKNGFGVFHVLASSQTSEISFHELDESHFLLIRPNLGYDFGSWAQSMDYSDILNSYQNLVFTNSSLHGPFTSPNEFIKTLINLKSHVKAAVESFQITPHFQSYIWAIESRTLYSAQKLVEFFEPFKNMEPDRELIIRSGELIFPTVLKECDLTYQCIFPAGSLCPYDKNPSLDAAETLIRSGFPYLKKALLLEDDKKREYIKFVKKYFPKSSIQI